MSSKLSFYFDESVQLAISEQLGIARIDVVSAHSLAALSDTDINHLQRATAMGHVLCTYDQDFLRLAAEGMEHSGIIFAQQQKATIGGWVRELRALHAKLTAEDAVNKIFFLSMK